MTDIFIKSYNRAFYLDRCLKSIKKHINGDVKITVLDDGTPVKYLEKIKAVHPEIHIEKSANYEQKYRAVEENIRSGKDIDSFKIPTDLWYDAAKNGSDYFIMTEDDVWFCADIELQELVGKARKNKIELLKLGWLANYRRDSDLDITTLDDEINITQPKDIFLGPRFIMDLFLYNKFKFFSLLYRLKLVDNHTKLKYWALNNIMMGIWKKDYWLFVWKDAKGRLDETQQLRNAAVYYTKHKNNPNFIARTKKEVMKTTFQSSATNSYHEYGYIFDVNLFNHLINEAWLNGEFDAMQNFPKDFSTEYFDSFIKNRMDVAEFRKWVEKFKDQYRNLGSVID